MKRAFTFILLLTYSTIMLKPALPFIKDAAAHILFFEEHMATVHAHNGKFHAHLEMKEAEKNEKNQQSTNGILKKEVAAPAHIIPEIIDLSAPKESSATCFEVITAKPAGIFLALNYPPPKI